VILANVGIPLIGAAISLGWLTVIPVAILEAVIAKVLLRWHFACAVKWVTLANLLTMLLGIPVTWFLAVLFSAFTGGGGWGGRFDWGRTEEPGMAWARLHPGSRMGRSARSNRALRTVLSDVPVD
jgi:hypothetical protein